MVLESNGSGVGEKRLWCKRVTVVVSESNGYGVKVMVVVLASKSYGVKELRLWC
jgi:hypothetical protein